MFIPRAVEISTSVGWWVFRAQAELSLRHGPDDYMRGGVYIGRLWSEVAVRFSLFHVEWVCESGLVAS